MGKIPVLQTIGKTFDISSIDLDSRRVMVGKDGGSTINAVESCTLTTHLAKKLSGENRIRVTVEILERDA